MHIENNTSISNINFQHLFEAAPSLFLVLDPKLKIVAASNAYLKATMTKRNDIVGRDIFEVFPDNPNDPNANGVKNLKASLNRVLQNKSRDLMPVQKYDIKNPEVEDSSFEERYWSPLNTPVIGENGEVTYIIHKVEDVTELKKLRQQSKELGK